MSGQFRSGGGGGMQKSGYDASQLVARAGVLAGTKVTSKNPPKAQTTRMFILHISLGEND
jgi:hypothetical protein